MREIKFRAWNMITRKMSFPNSIRLPWEQKRDGVYLMQFTGLLDRQGNEIFEGDIVKILYTDWPSCSSCHKSPQEHMNAIALTRVVIWSKQGFYVSHKVDGWAESMEPGAHGFIEIIGNIYSNPELLIHSSKTN
jgi:uncharacterized phage protein (TIGR01671 family)